jgi:hypothetical protein
MGTEIEKLLERMAISMNYKDKIAAEEQLSGIIASSSFISA